MRLARRQKCLTRRHYLVSYLKHALRPNRGSVARSGETKCLPTRTNNNNILYYGRGTNNNNSQVHYVGLNFPIVIREVWRSIIEKIWASVEVAAVYDNSQTRRLSTYVGCFGRSRRISRFHVGFGDLAIRGQAQRSVHRTYSAKEKIREEYARSKCQMATSTF